MRLAVTCLVFCAGAALVFLTDLADPQTPLGARLARRLAAAPPPGANTPPTDTPPADTPPADTPPADTPPADTEAVDVDRTPVVPPRKGEPAPADELREEKMPSEEAPAGFEVRRVVRAPNWVVYLALGGSGPPPLNPVVGQSAVVVSRDTVHGAGRLTPDNAMLWIVEFGAPVAKPSGEGLRLLAAGPDALSCVLLRDDAARAQAYACVVFAAAPSARAIRVNGVALVETARDLVPAAPGEIGEVDLPTEAVSFETRGARFTSALPADAPARVPALRTAAVTQALATTELAGTLVPLLFAFDGRVQVAGTIEVTATFEVTLPGATFRSLVEGTTLPALGSADLAHSVPGVPR